MHRWQLVEGHGGPRVVLCVIGHVPGQPPVIKVGIGGARVHHDVGTSLAAVVLRNKIKAQERLQIGKW